MRSCSGKSQEGHEVAYWGFIMIITTESRLYMAGDLAAQMRVKAILR